MEGCELPRSWAAKVWRGRGRLEFWRNTYSNQKLDKFVYGKILIKTTKKGNILIAFFFNQKFGLILIIHYIQDILEKLHPIFQILLFK